MQTYRVILGPIGRSPCGSCAAGCACSAVKPRCSCRRWTKRGGQLPWVRLFLSCRQLRCARTDGVQCTTSVFLSCWDLYTKHSVPAQPHTHTHTRIYPCLAHFMDMLGSKFGTWNLSVCLSYQSIYQVKLNLVFIMDMFRCYHNSCLLNDSSYLSIQTF